MQNPYLEQKGTRTALDCFIVLYSITNLLAPIVIGDMINWIAWFDRLIYSSVTMFRTYFLIFLVPLEILALLAANIWLGYRFAEYRWIILATILANLFATAFSGEYTIFMGLVTWWPVLKSDLTWLCFHQTITNSETVLQACDWLRGI